MATPITGPRTYALTPYALATLGVDPFDEPTLYAAALNAPPPPERPNPFGQPRTVTCVGCGRMLAACTCYDHLIEPREDR